MKVRSGPDLPDGRLDGSAVDPDGTSYKKYYVNLMKTLTYPMKTFTMGYENAYISTTSYKIYYVNLIIFENVFMSKSLDKMKKIWYNIPDGFMKTFSFFMKKTRIIHPCLLFQFQVQLRRLHIHLLHDM